MQENIDVRRSVLIDVVKSCKTKHKKRLTRRILKMKPKEVVAWFEVIIELANRKVDA